ncbi:LysM peptidoglycan-binding domain-containing protein [Algoriphagus sp. D3-2-R+10]|uniref:CIS tube protein n=1 Tax=Algoriphagus aurantiacus TaxID=3103948 RepID=UPI002B3F3F8D|nr:LysM peptidoglycan-binding domain-containing protein [Algoriphagus sp. D3-2-R+10]MEB2773752.1 LysM peptidoglycan-binding domain-containing protein [Algoriphagus sp. D3-2-R+10]
MLDLSQKAEKLYVQAYSDAEFENPVPENKFSALINPASYNVSYKFEFDATQAPGTSGANMKFNRILPGDFNFDFLFDGTGVVKDMSVLSLGIANPFEKPGTVTEQIEAFKQKIIDYQSDKHRPYYLKIHWGELLFKGVLKQMDIEYKVFAPDGKPIRAIAKCQFAESIADVERTAREGNESPDITHERIFGGTDRLDRMTEKIYEKDSHYINVAGFNSLDSFRNIPTGSKIYFPPLAK